MTRRTLFYPASAVENELRGATIAQEGAYHRCLRHIAMKGPLPPEAVRKLSGECWDFIRPLMSRTKDGRMFFGWMRELCHEPVLPWDTPEFRSAWRLWKAYKAEKRHSYKPIGEQAALRRLSGMFRSQEEAIAAIHHSMAMNYQGIYPAHGTRTERTSTVHGAPATSEPQQEGPGFGTKMQKVLRIIADQFGGGKHDAGTGHGQG